MLGPLDHGFCKSIYFGGPENLVLEVSTSNGQAIDAEAWIDPEVVALNGISPAELARYKNPAPWARPATPVPQPPAGTNPAIPGRSFISPAQPFNQVFSHQEKITVFFA